MDRAGPPWASPPDRGSGRAGASVAAARRARSAGGDSHGYLELLRGQVVVVADRVRRWTSTDEKVPAARLAHRTPRPRPRR